MKKKFKIILLLILFLIPLNVSATNSYRCIELFEKIKNSDDPYLHYYPSGEYNHYGFIFHSVLAANEKNELEWFYERDRENYPIIGRIDRSDLIDKISIGDKVLSIDDKSLKSLNDDEINELIQPDIEKKKSGNLLFERDGKKFNLELKLSEFSQTEDVVLFILNDINKISQIDSKFTANLYLQIDNYFDYGTEKLPLGTLIFDNITYINDEGNLDWENCQVKDEDVEKFRIPNSSQNIVFKNQISINKNTQNRVIEITPFSEKFGDDTDVDYVTIRSELRGVFDFRNHFDLKTFPFDKQKLTFEIMNLLEIDEALLDYKDTTVESLDYFIKNKSDSINGWRVLGYNIENTILRNSVGEPRQGIKISLDIERKSGYYIYKVILPILLILMVCWSVVWINPDELESKLTITIVCLLSLIAYNFVIDSEIPKLDYLTVLDWIILISYIYATIPNFLSIITYRFYRSKKTKIISKIDNYSKLYGPTSYIFIVLFIILVNVRLNPEISGSLISWMSK